MYKVKLTTDMLSQSQEASVADGLSTGTGPAGIKRKDNQPHTGSRAKSTKSASGFSTIRELRAIAKKIDDWKNGKLKEHPLSDENRQLEDIIIRISEAEKSSVDPDYQRPTRTASQQPIPGDEEPVLVAPGKAKSKRSLGGKEVPIAKRDPEAYLTFRVRAHDRYKELQGTCKEIGILEDCPPLLDDLQSIISGKLTSCKKDTKKAVSEATFDERFPPEIYERECEKLGEEGGEYEEGDIPLSELVLYDRCKELFYHHKGKDSSTPTKLELLKASTDADIIRHREYLDSVERPLMNDAMDDIDRLTAAINFHDIIARFNGDVIETRKGCDDERDKQKLADCIKLLDRARRRWSNVKISTVDMVTQNRAIPLEDVVARDTSGRKEIVQGRLGIFAIQSTSRRRRAKKQSIS